jgi:hypothetical protein
MAAAVGVKLVKEEIGYFAILNGKASGRIYFGPEGRGKALAEAELEREKTYLERVFCSRASKANWRDYPLTTDLSSFQVTAYPTGPRPREWGQTRRSPPIVKAR